MLNQQKFNQILAIIGIIILLTLLSYTKYPEIGIIYLIINLIIINKK